MAQHDYDLAAHQSGLGLRGDLNDVLDAIVTLNSGIAAPPTPYADMLWMDTSTNPASLKLRNSDNNAWITLGVSARGLGITAKGASVASGATTDIWAVMDGSSIHVTGTTTITSLGTAPAAGAWKLLIFDAALTLTHNASTLVLPGSANVTTAATQMYLVYADTTTKMLVYPIGSSVVTVEAATAGQLQYTNTTTLTLLPYNGNRLFVNGANMTIPAGGITITTSGLSASTLYYIYSYNNSGTMALEISATAPAARETTSGIRYKTGDTSRTLVGMSRTNGSTQFTTATTRSFFNRQTTTVSGSVTTARTVNTTSVSEVHSETQAPFVCWDDDLLITSGSGFLASSTTAYVGMCVAVDAGLTIISRKAASFGTSGGVATSISGSYTGMTTGYHYATLAGQVSGGTGTYNAGVTGNDATGYVLTIKG